jgi:hypothetical protein
MIVSPEMFFCKVAKRQTSASRRTSGQDQRMRRFRWFDKCKRGLGFWGGGAICSEPPQSANFMLLKDIRAAAGG